LNTDDLSFLFHNSNNAGINVFCYGSNEPVNRKDTIGFFGTPIQWACAAIGAVIGWVFGDYVARSIGLFKGRWNQWQTYAYWAVRSLVVVGGSVLGWVSGPYLVTIVKTFLLAQKALWIKISGAVLSFFGLNNGFGKLSRAAEFGLQSYSKLRSLIKGLGLEAHHIIEQRLGFDIDLCVAVTRQEHQVFTNAWRAFFPYGMDYSIITKEMLLSAARKIYADYPSILKAIEEALK